jgi:N-acetyl-alpha-D-muramate 1-phosphate uridylyltransferase
MSSSFEAQAMVLAAGRGERMRPLTDHTPKPLLSVRGQALMRWHLQALAKAGVSRVVINTAWLGEQIPQALGETLHGPDGSEQQLRYSHEGQDFGHALETAGGILRALPLLDEVFWVAAGDVFAPDFDFPAQALARFKASTRLAHLWLVPNPEHNPAGDFGLSQDGLALNLPKGHAERRYTFSTLALYRREFFTQPDAPTPMGNPQGLAVPLAPMLRAAMDRGAVSATLYTGAWTDVGTPQRLAQLNAP